VVAIQRLIRPVLYIFEALSGVVNRFTGGESDIESYLTREEIETLVLSGEAAGALDPDEGAMIRGVLDLESTRVSAVMVSRTDMVALPDTATPAEAVSTAAAEGVTRMPVYSQNRDDVVGVVDLRDAIGANERGEPLASALHEPTFVPETQPVDELFATMRSSALRMAIVVDEFGAVVGIVTLEDVLEEIVGELVGDGRPTTSTWSRPTPRWPAGGPPSRTSTRRSGWTSRSTGHRDRRGTGDPAARAGPR